MEQKILTLKERLLNELYTWGKFKAIHEIGLYLIVEYYPTKYDGCAAINGTYEDFTSFHPFINERDTNTSYNSLEAAIVGAIAYKYDGGNSQAGYFFMKMIKQDQE